LSALFRSYGITVRNFQTCKVPFLVVFSFGRCRISGDQ